jgi:hypothetical protein
MGALLCCAGKRVKPSPDIGSSGGQASSGPFKRPQRLTARASDKSPHAVGFRRKPTSEPNERFHVKHPSAAAASVMNAKTSQITARSAKVVRRSEQPHLLLPQLQTGDAHPRYNPGHRPLVSGLTESRTSVRTAILHPATHPEVSRETRLARR